MDLEMKEIFIEKRLTELNAPDEYFDKCYESLEIICKVYDVLKRPFSTLYDVRSCFYNERKIVEGAKKEIFNNHLFVKRIALKREKIRDFNVYPFNIEVLKNFHELSLEKNVSFLIGDNGIGKSTLIEALAIVLGMNPEGGTENFTFSTKDTHSELHDFLLVSKGSSRPTTRFFFRAETFYNFATDLERVGAGGYGRKKLHNRSHGESFMQLINNRFSEKGLYVLDEPEAALSPANQLKLLAFIDRMAKNGSQFIIATHSPILISYVDGAVYDLNNNFKKTDYKQTDTFNIYRNFIYNPIGMQFEIFEKRDKELVDIEEKKIKAKQLMAEYWHEETYEMKKYLLLIIDNCEKEKEYMLAVDEFIINPSISVSQFLSIIRNN